VKWFSRNKQYYIERGYLFTKMYDIFKVNIDDLQSNSNIKVYVRCDICNKIHRIPYQNYNKSFKKYNYYACSLECCKLKRENTNIEKYGVKNPISNKYIRKKIEETNLKKYGVDNPIKNPEVRNKILKTSLQRYGFEYPIQNESIREKSYITNIKRYGTKYPAQNEDIKIKSINYLKEKYGDVFFKLIPKYNTFSIQTFDIISEKTNLHIQHALNGGEKQFYKYFVDGFISSYNIVLEWDERKHQSKKYKEKDIVRQTYIEEHFKCKFIRINQNDFLKNKISIEDICEIIKSYIIPIM
jgi:hypothetical protein